MSPSATSDSSETGRLLERAAQGDQDSWRDLLTRHAARLRAMVSLRLDRRLQGRIDPSDVLQEAYLDAFNQFPKYLEQRALPFFLWLRLIAGQRLMILHRRHLGAQLRDAGREVSLYRGSLPETTSAALAAQLLGRESRPSEAAMQAERSLRLQEALNRMDPVDREVLTLRHFELLTNTETAEVLGIRASAASKRYVRALKRLKEVLAALPGGGRESAL
jgi:RNA polymerase sigma-70 factor (ECF subfamily)